MGGLILAWAVAEGIVIFRWGKAGAPPTPGSLLAVSGFFALLGALAVYPPARPTASLIGVGIDIAALLQVLPGTQKIEGTGWPPPMIADPTVVIPPSAAAVAGQSAAAGFGAGLIGNVPGAQSAGQGFAAGLGIP